jgi:3-hydroxybutyryl-CoA dehydratase
MQERRERCCLGCAPLQPFDGMPEPRRHKIINPAQQRHAGNEVVRHAAMSLPTGGQHHRREIPGGRDNPERLLVSLIVRCQIRCQELLLRCAGLTVRATSLGEQMNKRAEPQLFADDLVVGQQFVGEARTIGDEQFGLFARLTGDDHPIHYDDAFASKTRFGKRLAHGLLLMSMTALGATAISRQLQDAMVALVEQRCRFLKPIFVGDTVTSQFEVAAIDHKPRRDTSLVRLHVRLLNSSGEVVLEGEHAYFLRRRGTVTAAGRTDAA